MKKYIGIEIGGTKQQICSGLEDGTLLSSKEVKLECTTAEQILSWLETSGRELLAGDEYAGVGIGFGGPIESKTGRVLSSLQVSGWKDFDLTRWAEDTLQLPAVVANDTYAGGIAELKCGAGRGSEHLLYTNIGTGIGGGFYIHGEGFDGSGYGAAYLGNTIVPDWRRKEPAAWTRMELLCSGKSISERLSSPGYVPETSVLKQWQSEQKITLTAAELGKAARLGDHFAELELDRIASTFSIGLVNALTLLGPDRVVIGGGVAKMGDVLFDRIRRMTDEKAFIANRGRYEIRKSILLDQAVPVGALLMAARGDAFLAR